MSYPGKAVSTETCSRKVRGFRRINERMKMCIALVVKRLNLLAPRPSANSLASRARLAGFWVLLG